MMTEPIMPNPEFVEVLNVTTAVAMTRKIERSEDAGIAVDIAPVVLLFKGETYSSGEAIEFEVGTPPAQLVRDLLRQAYEDRDLRDFDFVACATDSFVRLYDDKTAMEELMLNPPPTGALAEEYSSNPLTDVREGFAILVFDRTGAFIDAFHEYKRDDKGMPVPSMQAFVSQSVRGANAVDVFEAVEEFVTMCRVSPVANPLPPPSISIVWFDDDDGE